ncbi:MAG: heavy metal translocating P-type ATPase, partial [Spirochaeta sp.]
MFKSNQDLSVQETSCGSDGCGCGSSGQPLFARDDQSRKGAVGLINSSNLLHVLRIALSLALLAAGIAGSRMLPVYIQWAGFVLAYLLVGWTVVRTAVRNILRGKVFDEMFLMTIATLGAFAIGEPAEAVAVMLFYSVGEFFQDAAVDKSRRSIAALMNLRPEKARVLRESREPELIAPEEVMVGWIIEVLPGERIPLDGDVVSGESSLDTSALTGESIPRSAGPGDEVAAGYINESGRLHIQVTREFSQSSVSRILQLVQEASERKAPTERFISRFAGTYTRIVVGIAAVLAVLPPLLLADAAFSDWIYR